MSDDAVQSRASSSFGRHATGSARIRSALPQSTDIGSHSEEGSFVPGPDSCSAAKSILFNHLVGGDLQSKRHCEPERLGRFEIDHQLKLRWLHDRQIASLGALENLAGVDAG